MRLTHRIFCFISILFITILNPSGKTARSETTESEPAPHFLEKAPLILGEGEQRLIHIPNLRKYSLGSDSARMIVLPQTLSSKLGKKTGQDTLLIKGVRPGYSDLWIWKSDGQSEHRTIQIEKWGLEKANPLLEKALSGLQETEVYHLGGGIFLKGTVHTLSEASQIRGLTDQFPNEIHDETEIDGKLLSQGIVQLEKWIQSNGYGSKIKLERQGGAVWVRGAFARPLEKSNAERQIRALYPPALLEFDSLPDRSPTVHFRVFLLELKKNGFYSLGLSWPPKVPNAFQITSFGIQEALKLDLALQALEGNGTAKILSRPELAVRAPGEAELFAGGEIPIRTVTHYSSSVTWKSYGLLLKLKVAQVAGDKVRLDIATEVSHLDPHLTEDHLPSLQANRMKTQVDAEFGKPLLLSGLLQEDLRREAKGLPVLKNIPILGSLFGSEDYLNERSELVAILLPLTNPPPAPMQKFERILPKGPVPPPRDWVPPEVERELKTSVNFPWNVFRGE